MLNNSFYCLMVKSLVYRLLCCRSVLGREFSAVWFDLKIFLFIVTILWYHFNCLFLQGSNGEAGPKGEIGFPGDRVKNTLWRITVIPNSKFPLPKLFSAFKPRLCHYQGNAQNMQCGINKWQLEWRGHGSCVTCDVTVMSTGVTGCWLGQNTVNGADLIKD